MLHGYSAGPSRDMWSCPDATQCSFCSTKDGPFFYPAGQDRHGCLSCLTSGRFTVFHETELGALEEGRLAFFDPSKMDMVPIRLPAEFDPDALDRLAHTPQFKSHQSSMWLTHCGEFMAYVAGGNQSIFRERTHRIRAARTPLRQTGILNCGTTPRGRSRRLAPVGLSTITRNGPMVRGTAFSSVSSAGRNVHTGTATRDCQPGS